jgi:hypothetical protein
MTTAEAPEKTAKPKNPPAMALRRIGHIYADAVSAVSAEGWAPPGVDEDHLWPDLPVREATKAEKAAYEARADDPEFSWLYGAHGEDIRGPLAGVCRECMGTGKALAGLDLPVRQMFVPCPNGCPLREDVQRDQMQFDDVARRYAGEADAARAAVFPDPVSSIWIPRPDEGPATMPYGMTVTIHGRPDDTAVMELDDHATEVMDRFNSLHDSLPEDDYDRARYDDGSGDDRHG